MPRSSYSAEFKAKIVLEVLQGEKELNVTAAEQGINPNMVRNWKKEFIANASQVFDEKKQAKEAQKRLDEALGNKPVRRASRFNKTQK